MSHRNAPLIACFVIVMFFQALTWKSAVDQTKATNRKFCAISIPSWNIRNELIHEVNEPSSLSKLVDPSSPAGQALLAQVDKTNKRKTQRLAKDLKLNGPRPKC
jgi:hypothetical protein